MGRVLHRDRTEGVLPQLCALMDVWCSELPYDITIPPSGGVRTNEEQAKLYALGRTVPGPHAGEPGHLTMGDCVTKAQTVNDSAHGHRAAIDAMPLLDDGHLSLDRHDPRWPETFARLLQMAHLAIEMGFEWGGDWPGFKDWDHFELPNWRSYPTGRDDAEPAPAPSCNSQPVAKE